GQAIERGHDRPAVAGALGGVRRRLAGSRGHGLVQGRHERLAPPARRSDAIDGARARARDHPGFGAAPRRVVARGVPPGLPEHLLEDVARVGALADDPEDEREYHGRIVVVEDGEGIPVTGSHLPDEIRSSPSSPLTTMTTVDSQLWIAYSGRREMGA